MKSEGTQDTSKETDRATCNMSESFKDNWKILCTCVHSSLHQEWEESKFIIRAITWEKTSVKIGIKGLLNKVSFAAFSCAGGLEGQSMQNSDASKS